MNAQQLNSRKKEILDYQEGLLKRASEAHKPLTATENAQFDNLTKELDSLNVIINRVNGIAQGRQELGHPRETGIFTDTNASKFYALAGAKSTTPMNVDESYVKGFWRSLKSPNTALDFQIKNAALGEGGTAADGSYLVPIETDPSIPNLAMVECSARQLSKVMTTDMNINIPFQSAKSVAAVKAESNNSGTNAFGTSVPQFNTTLLSAFVVGNSIYASWELLEDAKAANQFIPAELQRAIRTEEEYLFINGTGSGQPQGYLGNATTATGASITAGAAALGINPILDTLGSLNRAYYANAKWLVNRQEALRLFKAQVAASQFQTYITFTGKSGGMQLLGFDVEFSYEMPVYSASPSVNGQWLFGDFNAFAVIGDRGDSNIRIKVLDQVAALNGQTVILGYRRTDQRIVLTEAVVNLQTTS